MDFFSFTNFIFKNENTFMKKKIPPPLFEKKLQIFHINGIINITVYNNKLKYNIYFTETGQ